MTQSQRLSQAIDKVAEMKRALRPSAVRTEFEVAMQNGLNDLERILAEAQDLEEAGDITVGTLTRERR